MESSAQSLVLPARSATAFSGQAFAQDIAALPLSEREERIFNEIIRGNVPPFLRTFCPVQVTNTAGGRTNVVTFFVTPDYLAVGSDTDYFLTPMTPVLAQRLADQLSCVLPTPKMVDAIYKAAPVKLLPLPIPPSPEMTSVPVFMQHNNRMMEQRREHLRAHPLGALVAGHKKDVVITPRLTAAPGKVAIYGWHRPEGRPIQPLYLGHGERYADYSHGIRLVWAEVIAQGQSRKLVDLLADERWAGLLSDEGPIANPRYAAPPLPTSPAK